MKTYVLTTVIFLLAISFTAKLSAAPVLVETDWLAQHINDEHLVIIDTSDHIQYLRFHIKDAIHIDYNEIVYQRKPDGISVQVPNDYFIKLLAQRGIINDSKIVIYDDMGGLNAGRLFWQLEQIGHKEVSVLNGGLVKWILEKRAIENTVRTLLPSTYTLNTSNNKRNNFATIKDLQQKDTLLIDARTKEEYIGDTKQAPRQTPNQIRSGHIPGAILWDWQENLDIENGFSIKTKQQISQQLKSFSLDNKQQKMIAYCRSGHRAAQTYLTLRSMGFEQVKLYDASMAEYYKNKTAPLEKGCTHC